MKLLRSLAILIPISVLAPEAGMARAQNASTTARQAASTMPCPSGSSSCGNGAPPASEKPLKRKHRKREDSAAQEKSAGGNPNQKVEEAPPNDPRYTDPGPEE